MKALYLVLLIGMGFSYPVRPQNLRQQDSIPDIRPEELRKQADALILKGRGYAQSAEYDEAITSLQSALELQQYFLPPNHPEYAETLLLMGTVQIEKSTYATAIPYLEKSVTVYRISQGENNGPYTNALEYLAKAYLYHGRYKDAITTLEQVLVIQQKVLPDNHPALASTYLTFGVFQKYMKNYNDALSYFYQALDNILAQPTPRANSIANCYSEIGQIYLHQKHFTKALQSFIKEDSIMIESGEYLKGDYLYTCNDLGKAYLALGHFQQATFWNEKAIAIARTNAQSDHLNLATLHLYLGRSQLGSGQFEAAIASFLTDDAILRRLYGTENTRHYHCYAALGDAYAKWYLWSGADSLLDMSRSYFERMTKVVESSVRLEQLSEARNKILSEAMPYYEAAIQTEYLWYEKQPNSTKNLDKAWQLSETMHSYLLYSATQEANARHFARIPDAEIQRDSAIQSSIVALEKKRNSLINIQKRSLTDSLIVALDVHISDEKNKITLLRAYFEQKYPDYYQLKYDLQITSLQKIQENLSLSQTLLEYFVGDSALYVFVVQSNRVNCVQIKRDFPLDDWVNACLSGIYAYHNSLQKSPEFYQKTVIQYAHYAYQLYAHLVLPLAAYLTPELIVIPAESLSKLPFEALLSAPPKDVGNFKTFPFLVQAHDIQYAYSATMLHQMTMHESLRKPEGELLAFAPFYGTGLNGSNLSNPNTDIRLSPNSLPYSGAEVFRANESLGGQSLVLVGANATKKRFLELASSFRILHLATHSQANYDKGKFCFLAFSEAIENPETGLISVAELYNLSLNADLVVLSACETGIGEQQRGEGVMSLARAFAYAGARSVVASLWPVNDQSTMQIMDYFYGGIHAGQAKNKALAAAKRQYLNEFPGLSAHPFFWAGFVGVGALR